VYADGLRNPYGLAFGPDGRLYATNLGYDDRGVRAVRQSPDWVVQIKEGAWYGWPDFAGVRPLADPAFRGSRRGVDLQPLIADPPPVEPPLAELPPHTSPMKLAVSPGGAFGDKGGLYVAVFGDAEPLVEDLSRMLPTGILRIDPQTGEARPFLGNRSGARADRYGQGIKRAIACAFVPDGSAMYVLDFGQIDTTDLAPNPIPRTGVLWRIVRSRPGGQPERGKAAVCEGRGAWAAGGVPALRGPAGKPHNRQLSHESNACGGKGRGRGPTSERRTCFDEAMDPTRIGR
jgi:glucose/arabinose dehydrogenase